MREHCLQILDGDAVVLAFMLLPVLSRVTVTGAGNNSRMLSWNRIALSCLGTPVQKTSWVQLLDPGGKPCYSSQHCLCCSGKLNWKGERMLRITLWITVTHESTTRAPAAVTGTRRQQPDPRHRSCDRQANSGRVAGSYPTRSRRGSNHSPAEGHRAARPAAGSGQRAPAPRRPVPGGKEMLVASFGKPYIFMEQCSVKVL